MKRDDLTHDDIWSELRVKLGDELLAQLMRVPSNSVVGFARNAAASDVDGRAEFLASVLQNLGGTYNAWGIRRWFVRPRAQLDGRSPLQVLLSAGDWTPEGPEAESVATLARALLGMPAT